jgi:hypothetical protein
MTGKLVADAPAMQPFLQDEINDEVGRATLSDVFLQAALQRVVELFENLEIAHKTFAQELMCECRNFLKALKKGSQMFDLNPEFPDHLCLVDSFRRMVFGDEMKAAFFQLQKATLEEKTKNRNWNRFIRNLCGAWCMRIGAMTPSTDCDDEGQLVAAAVAYRYGDADWTTPKDSAGTLMGPRDLGALFFKWKRVFRGKGKGAAGHVHFQLSKPNPTASLTTPSLTTPSHYQQDTDELSSPSTVENGDVSVVPDLFGSPGSESPLTLSVSQLSGSQFLVPLLLSLLEIQLYSPVVGDSLGRWTVNLNDPAHIDGLLRCYREACMLSNVQERSKKLVTNALTAFCRSSNQYRWSVKRHQHCMAREDNQFEDCLILALSNDPQEILTSDLGKIQYPQPNIDPISTTQRRSTNLNYLLSRGSIGGEQTERECLGCNKQLFH